VGVKWPGIYFYSSGVPS